MKKKILFVINQLYKGGAEQSLVSLLQSLDPAEYDVDLLVYDHFYVEHAISLLPEVPAWVRCCSAALSHPWLSVVEKGCFSLLARLTLQKSYHPRARAFVEGRRYDIAISYGEWFLPDFIVRFVTADKKAVWIHCDLSQAAYFSGDAFFVFDSDIDSYLFVSEHSRRDAIARYPFIEVKTAVVHNTVNDEKIKALAVASVEDRAYLKPLVVTVSNFRPEKNHLRQLAAMDLLKKEGVDFTWLNIGSTSNPHVMEPLRKNIRALGLEQNFIILGKKENPYAYMQIADIVAVLSDSESWSLAITEAKILQKPVLATRTSGALEQIIDGQTGILTDFCVTDIAAKLRYLLMQAAVRQQLAQNLTGFSSSRISVREFSAWVERLTAVMPKPSKPELLYILDDVNYRGGAHHATQIQIAYLLEQGAAVTVFSAVPPNAESRCRFRGCNFFSLAECERDEMDSRGFWAAVWQACWNRVARKVVKIRAAVGRRMGHSSGGGKCPQQEALRQRFARYATVCVMSEGSAYRECVASLEQICKIQWIHTDYATWRMFNEYTRYITQHDGTLYAGMQHIVFVSEASRQGFIQCHPQLADKTKVVRNLLPVEEIRRKARMSMIPLNSSQPSAALRLVSVGRLESEKAFARSIEVARRLWQEGYQFIWDIIGDGSQYELLQQKITEYGLESVVCLRGYSDNPYSWIKNADVFTLFSFYEGLPNTVYEALIVGVPVMATNVGGIAEQIEDHVTGWLVANDEDAIYQGLKMLLQNQQLVKQAQQILMDYDFERLATEQQLKHLFQL